MVSLFDSLYEGAVVVDCEGSGNHARVQVHFERVGQKWLVAAFAGLRPI